MARRVSAQPSAYPSLLTAPVLRPATSGAPRRPGARRLPSLGALTTLGALSLTAACGGSDGAETGHGATTGGLAGTGGGTAGLGGQAAMGGASPRDTGGSSGGPSGGGTGPAESGAAGNGGTGASGGVATGGTATGGLATGGGTATGGLATGGDTATGGLTTGGGTATGGLTTGGDAATGGLATGGTATGGLATGGDAATGGLATGGDAATGGLATGGDSASGGAAGAAAGGTLGTGGAATGGDGGETGCDGETSGLSASAIHYVSPAGTPAGDGRSFASAMDFSTALGAVAAGEMILLEPGTYRIPYTAGAANTIELSKSGRDNAPIIVVAAHCGRAVLDFSFPEQAWVQDSYGLFVTGDHWSFKGIDITRAGYQGAYVTGQHNRFEHCAFYDNRNTGLEINEGGAYTTVLNCDAYRNYDPKKLGGMADGFAPKQEQGPGNVLVGCRAWENSDDGFDTFDSPEVVIITGSWAFRNGVDVWGYGGFDGNGNGFKLGGNYRRANHRITGSVAFDNVVKGFDQNHNTGGLTVLNCTAYANGTNFGLGGDLDDGERHLLRNNVSLGAADSIANADAQHNSWNEGFGVSASDFASLDLSLATIARNPDGTLPETALFRLDPASALVDAGVDVGLPYAGTAPELGAFELGG